MEKVFTCANQYVQESDWKDLSLLKICLCAMGAMIGLCVPKEKKKVPFFIAAIVFVITCIPLMIKFGKIVAENWCGKED